MKQISVKKRDQMSTLSCHYWHKRNDDDDDNNNRNISNNQGNTQKFRQSRHKDNAQFGQFISWNKVK